VVEASQPQRSAVAGRMRSSLKTVMSVPLHEIGPHVFPVGNTDGPVEDWYLKNAASMIFMAKFCAKIEQNSHSLTADVNRSDDLNSLDPTDLKILLELIRDPRIQIGDLSDALGAEHRAVARAAHAPLGHPARRRP
jgi:hypothetical protein